MNNFHLWTTKGKNGTTFRIHTKDGSPVPKELADAFRPFCIPMVAGDILIGYVVIHSEEQVLKVIEPVMNQLGIAV